MILPSPEASEGGGDAILILVNALSYYNSNRDGFVVLSRESLSADSQCQFRDETETARYTALAVLFCSSKCNQAADPVPHRTEKNR